MSEVTLTAEDLDEMLTEATKAGASDLHIRVGMRPMARVHSALTPLGDWPHITRDMAKDLVRASVTDDQWDSFARNKSLDFARAVEGVARFRCAYFLQQKLMSMVYRRIPDDIPTLADLAAPSVLMNFAREARGLVLVTGPTGSGKSTTLAAVLDLINNERKDHILTIEDPVEFVHTPKGCVINQREIGIDAVDFDTALRGALRQDPDVILVGEMRDLETIKTAITAAETGHLVFGTLHTSTADSTIDRIIDQYPANQQMQIRVMLAASLIGVVTQTLLPTVDGKGRMACHEVLVANTAVRASIRHGKMDQVRGIMQTQFKEGMMTMDRALAWAVQDGKVAEDIAREKAVDAKEFDSALASLKAGRDVARPQLVEKGQGTMRPVDAAPAAAPQSMAPQTEPATPSAPPTPPSGGVPMGGPPSPPRVESPPTPPPPDADAPPRLD